MLFSIKVIGALSSIGVATLTSAVNVAIGSISISPNCTADAEVGLVMDGSGCGCIDPADSYDYFSYNCTPCVGTYYQSKSACIDIYIDNGVAYLDDNGEYECGCVCTEDAYAAYTDTGSACYDASGCSGSAGSLSDPDKYGFQSCTCSTGYTYSNTTGGCTLGASPASRRRSRKSELVVEHGTDAFYCPDSETACAIGSGYECIDTTSSIDSCGGCLTGGGVNCLALPGSLGVACIDSKCVISSCFPGWSLVDGECIKA